MRNKQLRITVLQGRRKKVEGRINLQHHLILPGEPRRGDMIVAKCEPMNRMNPVGVT